ncbi:hypothetical protein F2Q68_00006647 [Brassica cretica]|uniref:Uncharacterized protein n=1 Tax=Brassica cretica TaxID=69181 RepID=A0A8S9JHV8_BRACR|nr:hypothetical protein F2Q68_00006647 [Brassica cretica]
MDATRSHLRLGFVADCEKMVCDPARLLRMGLDPKRNLTRVNRSSKEMGLGRKKGSRPKREVDLPFIRNG